VTLLDLLTWILRIVCVAVLVEVGLIVYIEVDQWLKRRRARR
jgi:hypothetical protein